MVTTRKCFTQGIVQNATTVQSRDPGNSNALRNLERREWRHHRKITGHMRKGQITGETDESNHKGRRHEGHANQDKRRGKQGTFGKLTGTVRLETTLRISKCLNTIHNLFKQKKDVK